jgi:asparagine synthase (glutamine-hydrolysing)
MCGIVGFRSNKNFYTLRESLPLAVSTLEYRGPDHSGFFQLKSGVDLGHRRLSIIDLSGAGRQPMKNDDGSVHIVWRKRWVGKK